MLPQCVGVTMETTSGDVYPLQVFYTALILVHTVYHTNYQKTKLVSCYGVQILWNNNFFQEMGNIRILSIIICSN